MNNLNLSNKNFFKKCKGNINVPAYRKKCYQEMERKMTNTMDKKYFRKMNPKEIDDYKYKMFIFDKLNYELFDENGSIREELKGFKNKNNQSKIRNVTKIIGTDFSEKEKKEMVDMLSELSQYNSRDEYLRHIQEKNDLDADTMEYCTYLKEYSFETKIFRMYMLNISDFDDPDRIKFDNKELQSAIQKFKYMNKDSKISEYEYFKKNIQDAISSYQYIYYLFNSSDELRVLLNKNKKVEKKDFMELMKRYKDDILDVIVEQNYKNNHFKNYAEEKILKILDNTYEFLEYVFKQLNDYESNVPTTFMNTLANYDKFMEVLNKIKDKFEYQDEKTFTNSKDKIQLRDYLFELFEDIRSGDSDFLKLEKIIVKKLMTQYPAETNNTNRNRFANCYKQLNFDEFIGMLEDIGTTRRIFEDFTNTNKKNVETFGQLRKPGPFYITPLFVYTLSNILCNSINCISTSTSSEGLYGALSESYKKIDSDFDEQKSKFIFKNRDYLFNSLYNSPNGGLNTNSLCTAFRGIGSDSVIFYKLKTFYSSGDRTRVLIHSYRDKDFIIHILRVYNTLINAPDGKEHTRKLIFLFYYLFCNWMPYKRGSAAIAKFLLRYLLKKKGFKTMKENTSNTLTEFTLQPLPWQQKNQLTMRVFQQFPYNYEKGAFGIGTFNYDENEIHGVKIDSKYQYVYYTDFGIDVSDKFKNFSANADVIAILIDDFDLFYKLMLERFYIPNVIKIESAESGSERKNTTAMEDNV